MLLLAEPSPMMTSLISLMTQSSKTQMINWTLTFSPRTENDNRSRITIFASTKFVLLMVIIFRLHILYGEENYSMARVVFLFFSDTFCQVRIFSLLVTKLYNNVYYYRSKNLKLQENRTLLISTRYIQYFIYISRRMCPGLLSLTKKVFVAKI